MIKMEKRTGILFYFVALLLQMIIAGSLDSIALLYICFIPSLVMLLPFKGSALSMIFAFLIGLAADILGGNILGLNAAAATLAGALREPILNLIFDKDRGDVETLPSIAESGAAKHITYIAAMHLAFFALYTPLDLMTNRSALFIIASILINTIVCSALAFFLDYTFLSKRS